MLFVIARYQEDVSWADGIPNCIIYNKSDTLPQTVHPIIQLPNVGREGHTYLYYIITNYDNLPEYSVFLQGFPFDHSPQLQHILNSLFNMIYREHRYLHFAFISQYVKWSNIENCIEHPGLNMIPVYKEVFGLDKMVHTFQFGTGAQFIVNKNAILSRSVDFYINIYKLLMNDMNPIEGYCIERFWQMIFTHGE
jgi:hypothetical protein